MYTIIKQPSYGPTTSSSFSAVDHIRIREWLASEIGKENEDWIWTLHFPHDSFSYDKFQFKYEEDKVKFILRWL